jgi:uncharacterized protein (DUF2141 family)
VRLFFYLLFLLLINFALSSLASDGPKKSGTLVVRFNGINSNNGNLIVALCNSDENYKNHKYPFIGKTIPINKNTATLEIDDLPFGDYAIKAFHDEDANNDLNTNILGIPTEDYGFSNNARGIFGPPGWEDAKFKFNVENKIIEIEIK